MESGGNVMKFDFEFSVQTVMYVMDFLLFMLVYCPEDFHHA